MISTTVILISACVVAALVSTAVAAPKDDAHRIPTSPCPNLFHYDSVDQPGQWTGTLQLLSDDDLHGLWLRLIFQNKVKEVNVDGDYEVVSSTDNNEVLVKNRNILLKAEAVRDIKITVKYEGHVLPELIGYRINAKDVCPLPNTKRTDFFSGDSSSRDFIATISSSSRPTSIQPEYKCGLTPSSETYPWQAAIFIKQGDQEKYICEATLISPSHVLTPAHCVTFKQGNVAISESSLLVYLDRSENSKGAQKALITKVTVHPGYDSSTLFNDIAVLQLQSPVTITDNIRPICLNTEENTGSPSTIVGYNIEQDGETGNTLVEASVKKIESNDCAKEAPELENILGDNSYCATYLLDNVYCAGGSGSSLISYKDKVATLRGIVSLGIALQNIKECNNESMVIVTDTSRYLKWIRHVL